MKDLKYYLPLYLGQKATHNLWKDKPIGILSAVNLKMATIDFGEFDNDFPYKNVILLLRKLSSITIEEGAWCLKETFFDHVDYPIKDFKLELVGQEENNPRISINNDWFKEELTFGCKRGSIWGSGDAPAHNVKIQAKIFHFLLSKGFDLFNLIPEGLALDLTTVKP